MGVFEADNSPYHGDEKDQKTLNDGDDDPTHPVRLRNDLKALYLPC